MLVQGVLNAEGTGFVGTGFRGGAYGSYRAPLLGPASAGFQDATRPLAGVEGAAYELRDWGPAEYMEAVVGGDAEVMEDEGLVYLGGEGRRG